MNLNSVRPLARAGRLTQRLTIVIAAMTTVGLCLAGSAQATLGHHAGAAMIQRSGAGAGDSPAVGLPKKCFYSIPDCTSSDPDVSFRIVSNGGTTDCTFQYTTDWGDGTSSIKTFPGGPDGSTLWTFQHKYVNKPSSYTVTVTGETTVGSCGAISGTLQFTLCTDGYNAPVGWDTEETVSTDPGLANYIEPLNVVISACSNVSLEDIEEAMPGPWSTVYPKGTWDFAKHATIPCISVENADVTGGGYEPEKEAWREEGCRDGNVESLSGQENHVRIWNQPVSGSKYGAWFIAASYETACVSRDGEMKLLKENLGYAALHPSLVFHCVDGGPGSEGGNGYDRGAADFISAIEAAGTESGWTVTPQIIATGQNVGEDGVAFSGKVYVLTVTTN